MGHFVCHLSNTGECDSSESPPHRNSIFNLPANLGLIPVLPLKIAAKKILAAKSSQILEWRRAINDLRSHLYCQNL